VIYRLKKSAIMSFLITVFRTRGLNGPRDGARGHFAFAKNVRFIKLSQEIKGNLVTISQFFLILKIIR
jgi:hypothetical protein